MLYLTDSLGQERRKHSKDKPKKKFKDRLISEVVRFLKICCVCLVISIAVFFVLKQFINNGSNTVPKQCTTVEDNLDIEREAKSHVESFHYFFYTLTPDKQYIDYTMNKAMYLVDETGLAQYNTLKENDFYDNIISSKSTFSVFCDSIKFDEENMRFIYYGHQKIERPMDTMLHPLITEGKLVCVPRTDNNPYGFLITGWRIIENYNIDRKLIK
jgi:conjugative transposon TraK protein